MKFAVVVVLFALAMGANSSIISSPLLLSGLPHASVAVHAAPAAVAVHAVPSPVQIVSSPALIQAAPALIQAAPAIVAVAPAEGTYVAKTRGAVHVAPLPGHINSAASVNLQPAPGTL